MILRHGESLFSGLTRNPPRRGKSAHYAANTSLSTLRQAPFIELNSPPREPRLAQFRYFTVVCRAIVERYDWLFRVTTLRVSFGVKRGAARDSVRISPWRARIIGLTKPKSW